MCAAYKRTYGNSFLRHRFSNDLKRTPPSPSLHKKTRKRSGVPKRARARIPITPPTVLSEDDDRCPAPLNASPETQKYRTKMFNKVGRESKSPSKDVNSSYVRGAVKDLLRKNDSVLVCLIAIFSVSFFLIFASNFLRFPFVVVCLFVCLFLFSLHLIPFSLTLLDSFWLPFPCCFLCFFLLSIPLQ